MTRDEPWSDTPAVLDLAQGLATHLAAWARELGAPEESLPVLRHAAVRLSLAGSEGHVCVWLEDVADSSRSATEVRGLLLASRVVGTPADTGFPLILDGDGRLYPRRHFEWERRLAAALVRRANAPAVDGFDAAIARSLDTLFRAGSTRSGDSGTDWQKIAVALALRRTLTVISGGPGTGKTTTVAAMLACMLELRPDLRIALAAPTGKAAARMLEALRSRALSLPESLRERLPRESFTIHRLLGVTRQAGRFRHHAGNPLAFDVLVVDEASMLDLALAARLADALPAHARLVLLGDKDQLAAVEAGAVFGELCADPSLSEPCIAQLAALCGLPAEAISPPAPRRATPLRDSVVWLVESHRFPADSGIGRLAAGINAGAGEVVLDWLRGETDASVRWIADDGAAPSEPVWREIADGQAGYREAISAFSGDPGPVFEAFDRYRVLCAVRKGPRGVDAVNQRLSRTLRQGAAHRLAPGSNPDAYSPWYAGRPVIVLRNDYLLNVYNGDVGICLPEGQGELRVVFPDQSGGWRWLAPLRLPPHDTAFAMTVHKSQGSEFGEVLVILPAEALRVMTRELLYTAVTRAARRVTVTGSEAVFAAACAAPTRRNSGLIDRMIGAEEGVGLERSS